MKKWLVFILCSSILCSCSDVQDENELYDLLLVCYNDFYELKDVSASDTLQKFEDYLIAEGHLDDNSGAAYRKQLLYLKENTYFKLPLKKIDFSNTLLYDNPTDLLYCVHDNFNIDSSHFLSLDYYTCAEKISETINEQEEINIHDMFQTYLTFLDEDEIIKPFVRESILQFFYRWYFTSKYNREIQLPELDDENLEPIIQDEVEVP